MWTRALVHVWMALTEKPLLFISHLYWREYPDLEGLGGPWTNYLTILIVLFLQPIENGQEVERPDVSFQPVQPGVSSVPPVPRPGAQMTPSLVAPPHQPHRLEGTGDGIWVGLVIYLEYHL